MKLFPRSERRPRSDHDPVFAEFALRLMAALVALHVGPVARMPRFRDFQTRGRR